MKIFKILLFHEMQLQIRSYNFIILISITMIISIVSGYVQIKNFNERHQNYLEEIKQADKLKRSFVVYSEFKVPIINSPNLLSIFAMGYDEKAANKVIVSPLDIPVSQSTSQQINPLLNIFVSLDITGVIIYILSITVLLISAGAISSEREENTLKLLFTNKISRLQFFFVKYLGIIILVSIALAFVFLIVGIMVSVNPLINVIDTVFLIKLFGIYISSLLYLSIYILMGLLISAFSKSTGISVITALLIWILIVYIYPNTIAYVVKGKVADDTHVNIDKDIEQKKIDFIKRHINWRSNNSYQGKYRGNKGNYGGINMRNGYPMLAGFPLKYAVGSKEQFGYYKNDLEVWLPKLWECQSEIMKLYQKQKEDKLKQSKTISYFVRFLPDMLYRDINEVIASTDRYSKEEQFLNNVKIYRDIIISYLEKKKAFGFSFFTPLPAELMLNNPNDYSQEIIEKYGEIEKIEKIKIDDLPVFSFKSQVVFPSALIGILIFNIILLFICIGVFRKIRLI